MVARQAEGGFAQLGFGFQRGVGHFAAGGVENADKRNIGADRIAFGEQDFYVVLVVAGAVAVVLSAFGAGK